MCLAAVPSVVVCAAWWAVGIGIGARRSGERLHAGGVSGGAVESALTHSHKVHWLHDRRDWLHCPRQKRPVAGRRLRGVGPVESLQADVASSHTAQTSSHTTRGAGGGDEAHVRATQGGAARRRIGGGRAPDERRTSAARGVARQGVSGPCLTWPCLCACMGRPLSVLGVRVRMDRFYLVRAGSRPRTNVT